VGDGRVVGPVRKRRCGCEQRSGCGDERDAEAELVVEVLGDQRRVRSRTGRADRNDHAHGSRHCALGRH